MSQAVRRCLLASSAIAAMWCLPPLRASAADGPGMPEYIRGLQALAQGKAPEAFEALSEAIEADDENADFYTARGVARVLAEKLPEAAKDLERSLKLRPGHQESRLWLASVVAMAGEFDRDSTIYPAATQDRYESYVRQAARDYGELAFRKRHGSDNPRAAQMRIDGRKKLIEGVAEFARRAKGAGGEGVVEAVTGAAKELYDSGDYAAALEEFANTLKARPEDPDALFYHASCSLELNDPTTAREEFTRVLTARTADGAAYLGRAVAAARLGDRAVALRDLKHAEQFKAADIARRRQQVSEALADLAKEPPPTKQLFDDLFAAAKQSTDLNELIDSATTLRRVTHGRQRRYDEWYQERLRELEQALRDAPQSADCRANLGLFLYEESSVRRERVEPRANFRLFRYQTHETQNQELDRAERLADEALAIDPKHVRALAVKASVRMWNGLYADAEEIVRRGLAIDPDSDELLERMAEVLEVAAVQKAAEARDLRSPQYLGSRQETVGDWLYTYTYYHHPTLEEKQKANELDAEAERCQQLALEQIQRAAKKKKGTAEGWYYQGVYHWRQQQLPEAQKCYQEALKLAPEHIRWHFNLAGILAAQGKFNEALEARIAGTRLIESSAPLLLELTWDSIAKTKWRTSRETLRRAVDLNAADARIPAYMGVVSAASEKPEDAAAWFRMAIAVEEARMRLRGKSLAADAKGPLSMDDYGLTMTLRRRLSEVLLTLEQPEEAAAVCQAAVLLEPRVQREDFALDIPSAMIPNPEMSPDVVPEAEHVLVLAAWNRVMAGQALAKSKKNDAAIQILTPIESFGQLLVNGKGADKLRRAELHAALHLAKAWLAKGNRNQAQRYAAMLPRKRFGSGPSLNPFAELEEEGTRLQEMLRGK